MSEHDTTELAAKLAAAMDGVTPGPWLRRPRRNDRMIFEVYPERESVMEFGVPAEIFEVTGHYGNDDEVAAEAEANARYIALCSPDNISTLLDENKALREKLAATEKALHKIRALDQVIVNNGTEDQARKDGPIAEIATAALAAIRGDVKRPVSVPKNTSDAMRLEGLRRLAGYIENGTGTTVKFSQDDATKWWSVWVGKDWYFAPTFRDAVDAAIADEKAKQGYVK